MRGGRAGEAAGGRRSRAPLRGTARRQPRPARISRAAADRARRRRAARPGLRAASRSRGGASSFAATSSEAVDAAARRGLRPGGRRRASTSLDAVAGRAHASRSRPSCHLLTLRRRRVLARRDAPARAIGPARVARLVDEVCAGSASTQVIVVSAAPEPPGPHALRDAALRRSARPARRVPAVGRGGRPCATRCTPADGRVARLHRRFGRHHNPIGPFDFGGGYDDRSDRRSRARRADEPRLRRRVPPVHRAGRRRRAAIACGQRERVDDENLPLGMTMRRDAPIRHARESRGRGHPTGPPADDADLRDDDVPVRQRGGGGRVQRGRSKKYLLLPLRQPDGRGGRAEARRARGRRGRAGVLVGAWRAVVDDR